MVSQWGQKRTCQNDTFRLKCLPNPTLICQNVRFWRFCWFSVFLDRFWTTVDTTGFILRFSPKPLSKPRGWCQNEKITEKHEKQWKSPKILKMSPTNLIPQKVSKITVFHEISCFLVKKCQKTPRTLASRKPVVFTRRRKPEIQWFSVIFSDFRDFSVLASGIPCWPVESRVGQWNPVGTQWGHSGDTVQRRSRTHTTGTHHGPAPPTVPHYPGTPPPLAVSAAWPLVHAGSPTAVRQASFGYRSKPENIKKCQF